MSTEGNSKALHSAKKIFYVGEISAAIENHVFEKVRYPTLIICLVKRARSDMEPQ
jgi:hypothetical protein